MSQDLNPGIGNIMTRDVIAVGIDDPLQEVARLMSEHNVSGFPVLSQDGRVVGVISEGDLIRRYRTLQLPTFVAVLGALVPVGSLGALERQIREIASVKVSEIMSRPAITARPDWSVARAADAMIRHRINRLPVVDAAGSLVGIITRADLVRTMAGPPAG